MWSFSSVEMMARNDLFSFIINFGFSKKKKQIQIVHLDLKNFLAQNFCQGMCVAFHQKRFKNGFP